MAAIVDVPAIRSLMDDFYELAHVPMGLLDLKGNILVGVGWQEICTRFHRLHPETAQCCLESDTQLSAGLRPGESRLYKCKNNLWDIATPILVGGRHVGNVFCGQFFFDDEQPDYDQFRAQARRYGFPEEEYLAALANVPRLSRRAVDRAVAFFVKLAQMLSQLGYANVEQGRLMASLRLSEEHFRGLAQAMPQIVWTADAAGEMEWLNERWGLYTGQKPGEGEGGGWQAAVHPEDRPKLLDRWRTVRRTGAAFEIEARFRRYDGEFRWFLDRAWPLRDETGKVVRWFGTCTDVHDLKQAEQAVRDREGELRLIMDAAPALIAYVDADGRYRRVNRGYERWFGRRADAIEGRHVREVVGEAAWPTVGPQVERALAGEVVTFEQEIPYRDAGRRWVRATYTPDRGPDGRVRGFVAHIVDIEQRKRVEDEVARLASFPLLNPHPVTEVDLAGRVCFTNPAADRRFPDLRQSGRDHPWLANWAEVAEACRNGGGKLLDREVLVDGRWYHQSMSYVPTVGRVRIYGLDITSRRQTDEALRAERTFVSAVLQTVGALVTVLDREGRIVSFNRACERATGYAFDEVKGRCLWDFLLVPEEVDAVRRVFANLTAGQFPNEFENYWVGRDGARRLIHWRNSCLTDSSGAVEYVIGSGIDVTEQRQAEQALREARDELERRVAERTAELSRTNAELQVEVQERRRVEDALRAERDFNITLVQTSPIFFVAVDLDGEVVMMNGTMRQALGYAPRQVVGRPFLAAFVAEADREAGAAVLAAVQTRRDPGPYECHVLAADGRSLLVQWRFTPVLKDQAPAYLFGAGLDITEQRRAEEQGRRQRAELAHAARLSAIGEMATGLAHELNQPLTSIIAYAQAGLNLARNNPAVPEDIRVALDRAGAQAERAGEIIKRMRRFARKQEAVPSPVNLTALIRETVEFLRFESQPRGVQVRLDLPETPLVVVADPVQIQQVLLNLLQNSLEAMDEVGPAGRRLTIRGVARPDRVQISVTDTGRGFDPNVAPRLFDSFFTTKAQGLGLGLSISYSIIEAHKGRLWAEANPGGGATFHFTLPVPAD